VDRAGTFDGIVWTGRQVIAMPRDLGQPMLYDPVTEKAPRGVVGLGSSTCR